MVTIKTRLREEHSDVAIHTIVKRKADIIFLYRKNGLPHRLRTVRNDGRRMDCHTVCGRFAMTGDEWIATPSADGSQ